MSDRNKSRPRRNQYGDPMSSFVYASTVHIMRAYILWCVCVWWNASVAVTDAHTRHDTDCGGALTQDGMTALQVEPQYSVVHARVAAVCTGQRLCARLMLACMHTAVITRVTAVF